MRVEIVLRAREASQKQDAKAQPASELEPICSPIFGRCDTSEQAYSDKAGVEICSHSQSVGIHDGA